ncbi:TetR family transcriptional regulator [Leucobacter viscericola]|uniref:TetR family transcriptional regulator n=1 Tax=Leucobacter viscericola TaxID=2714935 RepID=A0A6G7XHC9_9MICO|nr:TetR/AcrR family transcriptional regulator C-terminal domain-containing protein [Leucobacter viscericola]QIK63886.1 TetR family transcriptional regulator [Leucobacter viscericola]
MEKLDAIGSLLVAEEKQQRRAGRPKTPLLNRQLILETALRLLDERGESGASMREVARELGVRPSALYNHVSGREELIAGIREQISDRMDVGVFDRLEWDAAMISWADSYRAAFAAHPPTIALLATQPLSADARTSLMYDLVSRALVDAGWPRERALSVIVAIESFVLGSALDAAADPTMLDPGARDDVPDFAAAYAARNAHLAAAGTSPADDAFQLGIRAIVHGLRAELESLRGSALK